MAMRLLVGAKNEEYNKQIISKLASNKQQMKFAYEVVRRFRYRLIDFPSLHKALYADANSHFISRWQRGSSHDDFIPQRTLEELFRENKKGLIDVIEMLIS
jgi:hypothetical protein